MSARTWHSGPPPHVGWWNASIMLIEDAWRWWDGDRWSRAVYENESANDAAHSASLPAAEPRNESIKWTDYYPKNARVSRIDPAVAAIKQYLDQSIVMPAKKAGK